MLGKLVVWQPASTTDDGEPLPELRLSTAVKVKHLRKMKMSENPSVDEVCDFLSALFPRQAVILDELEVDEIGDLFNTWSEEFSGRQGVSLGEAQPSSATSTSIEEPSNTIGAPASA
jgi:hypothetical protein